MVLTDCASSDGQLQIRVGSSRTKNAFYTSALWVRLTWPLSGDSSNAWGRGSHWRDTTAPHPPNTVEPDGNVTHCYFRAVFRSTTEWSDFEVGLSFPEIFISALRFGQMIRDGVDSFVVRTHSIPKNVNFLPRCLRGSSKPGTPLTLDISVDWGCVNRKSPETFQTEVKNFLRF